VSTAELWPEIFGDMKQHNKGGNQTGPEYLEDDYSKVPITFKHLNTHFRGMCR
jgi:hypothetical protein